MFSPFIIIFPIPPHARDYLMGQMRNEAHYINPKWFFYKWFERSPINRAERTYFLGNTRYGKHCEAKEICVSPSNLSAPELSALSELHSWRFVLIWVTDGNWQRHLYLEVTAFLLPPSPLPLQNAVGCGRISHPSETPCDNHCPRCPGSWLKARLVKK